VRQIIRVSRELWLIKPYYICIARWSDQIRLWHYHLWSACKSYLWILDAVQNQALHLCLGAFRTSPVSSLHVEANEMPLDIRWRCLVSQYCLQVSSALLEDSQSYLINNQTASILLVSVLAVICRSAWLSSSWSILALHFTFCRFLSTCIWQIRHKCRHFLKVNFWNCVKTYTTIFKYTRMDLVPMTKSLLLLLGWMSYRADVLQIKPEYLWPNWSFWTSRLVKSGIQNIRNLSYSQTLYLVCWPFITSTLKLDTYLSS